MSKFGFIVSIFLTVLMFALIYLGGKWVYEKSRPAVSEVELQEEVKKQQNRNPADLWCDSHPCK